MKVLTMQIQPTQKAARLIYGVRWQQSVRRNVFVDIANGLVDKLLAWHFSGDLEKLYAVLPDGTVELDLYISYLKMQPRTQHQSSQASNEFQRRHHDVGGAIAPVCLKISH